MLRRMAGHSWRLHERYGEDVYPVVMVLCVRGLAGAERDELPAGAGE